MAATGLLPNPSAPRVRATSTIAPSTSAFAGTGDSGVGNPDPNSDGTYNYTPLSGSIAPGWQNAEANYQGTAFNTKGYATGLNNGVASESNLMGPSSGDSPEEQSLGARANQMYQSNVAKIASQATPMAQQATTQLQTQDLAHQAAIFSNEQSQAQINFKNASFQRSAAIQMANLKNQLYTSLFGGFAQVGGAGMAMITSGDSTGYGGDGSITNADGSTMDMSNADNQPGGANFQGPLPQGTPIGSQSASGDYNMSGGMG